MKRTRLMGSWLALSLLACGPVRIGNGYSDGGVAGKIDNLDGLGGAPIHQVFPTGGSAGTGGGSFILNPAAGGQAAGGTSQVVIPSPPIERTKLDILFMVDNSSSMSDKQQILATVVPSLVKTLAQPGCVDSVTGKAVPTPSSGECPQGSRQDFVPPADIHLGIISSSLGSHSVEAVCNDSAPGAPSDSHNNDNGRLLTRGGMPSAGFLTWTTGDSPDVPAQMLKDAVAAVGQHGCGYEAQLESVYRFLVDPEPPQAIVRGVEEGFEAIRKVGIDDVILGQRAAFLRPDSLVVVVLVSDEDDCSINEDDPQGWLPMAPAQSDLHVVLRSGTSVCQTNPNDPCCFNCAERAPAGCPDPSTDPACVDADGSPVYLTSSDDPANLRCWRQKQRYGYDFLYSVQRYVDGFSQPQVRNRSGALVTNPLFKDPACSGDNCPVVRDPGSILVTAVVGVPWQDVAEDPTDISKGFASSSNLANLWGRVLGDPQASPPVPPGDPLMIDSVSPRIATATANPLGAAALPIAQFPAMASANPINGHEWDTSRLFPQPNSDLQYACIFDLPAPRDCSQMNTDCDCIDSQSRQGGVSPADYKSPLCQDATGGYSTVQRRAKAYPGLRELQVVKGLGSRGIAASICPAVAAGDSASPAYGYNPVVTTILDRIRPHLPKP